jgi:cell division protein FtsW (lipid II flippase)
MGRQRPRSVTRALYAQATLVLVCAVATVATFVLGDELVQTWTERVGLSKPPSFAPVALVAFVVYALLAWVLSALFRDGNNWARLCLGALGAFTALLMVVVFRHDLPSVFQLLAGLVLLVDLALLVFLFHPETNAYLRGAEVAEEYDEAHGSS